METSIIPEAKESMACPQQHEGFVDFFSTPVGWSITNTHHKAKPSPKSTTRGYFIAFVMLCGENDRTCGQQKLGSSITTMHPPILRI